MASGWRKLLDDSTFSFKIVDFTARRKVVFNEPLSRNRFSHPPAIERLPDLLE